MSGTPSGGSGERRAGRGRQLAPRCPLAARLTESQNLQIPTSWHPSGKFLAFLEQDSQGNEDIWILPMEGDEASGWKPGKPTPFLNSPFRERDAAFSPDGHWLAYASDESGRSEIYVRPFPGPGSKFLDCRSMGSTG